MEIVETSVFTKQIRSLLKDDAYKELQERLVMNPLAGAVIPGSGGLRKIRWGVEGRGKSAGLRVIYYYVAPEDWIFMLVAYAKGAKQDLTAKELAALKKLVEEELS
jgi:hypothetical protein